MGETHKGLGFSGSGQNPQVSPIRLKDPNTYFLMAMCAYGDVPPFRMDQWLK